MKRVASALRGNSPVTHEPQHRSSRLIAMNVAGWLLCCSVVVSMTGCASFGSTMRSWLGRSENDLIAAWGKPATTQGDGHGGRILTYYAVTDRVVNSDADTVDRAAGIVRDAGVARGHRPESMDAREVNVSVRSSRQRNFWIDASGVIYSCSWQSPPGLFGRTPRLQSASLRGG